MESKRGALGAVVSDSLPAAVGMHGRELASGMS